VTGRLRACPSRHDCACACTCNRRRSSPPGARVPCRALAGARPHPPSGIVHEQAAPDHSHVLPPGLERRGRRVIADLRRARGGRGRVAAGCGERGGAQGRRWPQAPKQPPKAPELGVWRWGDASTRLALRFPAEMPTMVPSRSDTRHTGVPLTGASAPPRRA
jgi:hypothetical protein